jgi:hypothetical protein
VPPARCPKPGPAGDEVDDEEHGGGDFRCDRDDDGLSIAVLREAEKAARL